MSLGVISQFCLRLVTHENGKFKFYWGEKSYAEIHSQNGHIFVLQNTIGGVQKNKNMLSVRSISSLL